MFNAIFWFFIFVLGLSFFGISIQAIINSPTGQANFGYLLYVFTQVWHWIVAWLHSPHLY